jgi:MFS family permease
MQNVDRGSEGAAAKVRAPLSAWLGFAAMLSVYIYAVVDRQIFVLLAEPIRENMSLSDAQLGLLQGVGLALVGVLTTFPIAWLADRFDRRLVTSGCVLVWSAAVVLCGLAPNFAWLFVGASLVGVAEAGIGPAVYAMTGELFPVAMRQTANSIFAIAGRLGASVGVILAGGLILAARQLKPLLPVVMGALPDWRLAFLVAALFAPVAVLLMLTLPPQVSGAGASKAASRFAGVASTQNRSLLRYLRTHLRLQLGFFAGSIFGMFGFACIGAWAPIIAQRYFHQSPVAGGAWLGIIAFITGVAGFLFGSLVLRRLEPRLGPRLPMIALSACTAVGAACSLLIGFATSAVSLYGFWGLQLLFGMVMNMVTPTIMQNMAPVQLRARIFAVNGLATMVAAAMSPVVVGVVSDRLAAFTHTARPLQAAAILTSIVALLVSAILMWLSTDSYVTLTETISAAEPA